MINLTDIVSQYRDIRKRVFTEATVPNVGDSAKASKNKELLKRFVTRVCDEANLHNLQSSSEKAKNALWHNLWTKHRYAGIKADIATKEIHDIEFYFDDYRNFTSSDWDLESHGHTLIKAGPLASDFLNRTGVFSGKQTIGNLPKLKKVVAVANAFNTYFSKNPQAPAISFLCPNTTHDDVWAIHQRLADIGYKGDLTSLHFMMDAGFPVIKPDLVISRLLLDWGWLHFADPTLPHDLTRADLVGKGQYGSRYLYTKKRIYKPIIELANQVAEKVKEEELAGDIGWVTTNPVREFDLFIVKAGQLPEEGTGISRRLYA